MPRRLGDTFLLGTAMVAPFPQINTFVRAAGTVLVEGVILDGRPYGKEVARTSESRCVHSLASNGGKARAIAENSSVASGLAAP
jgi:hypothetical protein